MEDLVLAVTTRECIALRGLCPTIDLAMIESLTDETWFAVPSAITADPLAAEVRLVLIFQLGEHVLIDEIGRFAVDRPLPPEAFAGGKGFVGLKRHVEQLARELLARELLAREQLATEPGAGPCLCELAGYAFDPLVSANHFFLAYRCRPKGADGQLPAPVAGGSWVPAHTLDTLVHAPTQRWFLPLVTR